MYLENIREVPEVEDVMELDGSGQESGGHLLVKLQSHVDQLLYALGYLGGEAPLTDVPGDDALVNGLE